MLQPGYDCSCVWLSCELSRAASITSITCCCHRGACLLGLTQQDIRKRNFTSLLPFAAKLVLRVAVKVRMDFKTLLPSGDKRHSYFTFVILKNIQSFLIGRENVGANRPPTPATRCRFFVLPRDYVVSIFSMWFFLSSNKRCKRISMVIPLTGMEKRRKENKKCTI